MNLGFMQNLGNGDKTLFEEKILWGVGKNVDDLSEILKDEILKELSKPWGKKLHTMRFGDRWRAGMLLHMWYNQRQPGMRQINKGIIELEKVTKVDEFTMALKGPDEELVCDVNNKILNPEELERLAHNDGLSLEQFEWYFRTGLRKVDGQIGTGQIIHWHNGIEY